MVPAALLASIVPPLITVRWPLVPIVPVPSITSPALVSVCPLPSTMALPPPVAVVIPTTPPPLNVAAPVSSNSPLVPPPPFTWIAPLSAIAPKMSVTAVLLAV